MTSETLETITVSAHAPVNLGDGTSVLVDPLPDTVVLTQYDTATLADISRQSLSYEYYEGLRQNNPHINYPELKKPQKNADRKNPNSGPTPSGTPTGNVAVSLTPNVLNARVYSKQVGLPRPNAALQFLIDKAIDDRSVWKRIEDWGDNAITSAKRIATATWENPGEAAIGILKGIGNFPSDLANLATMAAHKVTPAGQLMDSLVEHMRNQALQAYRAGNLAQANVLASQASEIDNLGYVSDIFELSNDAQAGGSILSMFVPIGGIIKGAGKVGKITNITDAVADTRRATEGVVILSRAELPPHILYNKKNTLYRGDGRSPDELFKKGFDSWGTETDLLRHQTGGNSSIYISTSTSQEVAESFAKRQGSGSYIYEIDPKGLHGIDINSSLGSASKYPHEAEIAVVSKIPSRNIIGARPINADGSIGKFYSNPNYIPK